MAIPETADMQPSGSTVGAVLVAAVALFWPAKCAAQPLGAAPPCSPVSSSGTRRCALGLDDDQLARIAQVQDRPLWCWAASVSMLLAHHRVRTRQHEVVSLALGESRDEAASAHVIVSLLARPWSQEIGAVHAQRGSAGLTRTSARHELQLGRPMLLAAQGHVVLLVRVEVEEFVDVGAWRIVQGVVLDPRTGGARVLRPAELAPDFLVAFAPLDPGGGGIARTALAYVPPMR